VHIFQLQGFIFFGTANNLLNQVRDRIEATDLSQVRFVVLDFYHVTGLDSTAIMSFTRMIQLAQDHQVILVLTNPSSESALPGQAHSVARFFAQLKESNKNEKNGTVRIFSNLDHGLEWCENQFLKTASLNLKEHQDTLLVQLKPLLPDTIDVNDFLSYFARLEVGSGYCLTEQGDVLNHIYFIESGRVTTLLAFPGCTPFRLDTALDGQVVGEVDFILTGPAVQQSSPIHRAHCTGYPNSH